MVFRGLRPNHLDPDFDACRHLRLSRLFQRGQLLLHQSQRWKSESSCLGGLNKPHWQSVSWQSPLPHACTLRRRSVGWLPRYPYVCTLLKQIGGSRLRHPHPFRRRIRIVAGLLLLIALVDPGCNEQVSRFILLSHVDILHIGSRGPANQQAISRSGDGIGSVHIDLKLHAS